MTRSDVSERSTMLDWSVSTSASVSGQNGKGQTLDDSRSQSRRRLSARVTGAQPSGKAPLRDATDLDRELVLFTKALKVLLGSSRRFCVIRS